MKTLIIAEAGVNHNGSLSLAKKLIVAAKKCGADIIKFQKFKADNLATKFAKLADYQKENFKKNIKYKMLKRLELKDQDYKELYKFSKKNRSTFYVLVLTKNSKIFKIYKKIES